MRSEIENLRVKLETTNLENSSLKMQLNSIRAVDDERETKCVPLNDIKNRSVERRPSIKNSNRPSIPRKSNCGSKGDFYFELIVAIL